MCDAADKRIEEAEEHYFPKNFEVISKCIQDGSIL